MTFAYRRTLLSLLFVFTVPGTFLVAAEEDTCQVDNFWTGPRKPMVELSYGVSSLRHRLFAGELDNAGEMEIRLGYSKTSPKIDNVVDLSAKYVFFNYSASNLFGRSPDPAKVRSEISRFGIGSRGGFAYDLRSSYLYPYTQTALLWTRINTGRPIGLSANDSAILDRYEGAFRFGASAESGIAFGLGEIFSVRTGYEVTAIYPRYVFWPWLGSYALAMVGSGAISHFAEEIIDASPTLGPIIYTLLRGGLTYGYYLLVRDNQYWPFSSETPMTTDGFRFGFTMTF
jgi:hypothetical protein